MILIFALPDVQDNGAARTIGIGEGAFTARHLHALRATFGWALLPGAPCGRSVASGNARGKCDGIRRICGLGVELAGDVDSRIDPGHVWLELKV